MLMAIGFGLYQVKYQVMQLEDDIAMIDHTIAEEREALRVLKAEWQYLTSPGVLEMHGPDKLALDKVIPTQVSTVEDLDYLGSTPVAQQQRVLLPYVHRAKF